MGDGGKHTLCTGLFNMDSGLSREGNWKVNPSPSPDSFAKYAVFHNLIPGSSPLHSVAAKQSQRRRDWAFK